MRALLFLLLCCDAVATDVREHRIEYLHDGGLFLPKEETVSEYFSRERSDPFFRSSRSRGAEGVNP